MDKRLTGFLLPVVLILGLLLIIDPFGSKDKKQQTPQDVGGALFADVLTKDKAPVSPAGTDVHVWHSFGEPGKEGFTVQFRRDGAGVRRVLMHDHFKTADVAAKVRGGAKPERDDLYPIVSEHLARQEDNDYFGLVLQERPDKGKSGFKKDISGANNQYWQFDEMADAPNKVRFSLAVDDGLVMHKIYSFEPGRRDLLLEIRLEGSRQLTDADQRQYKLWLRGVETWNPKQGAIFGNQARAVAEFESSEFDTFLSETPAAGPPRLLAIGATGQRFSFAGTTNRFFGAFLYPEPGDAAEQAVSRVLHYQRPAQQQKSAGFEVEANSVPLVWLGFGMQRPDKGQASSLNLRVYMGPKSSRVFNARTEYERFGSILLEDLSPPCCAIPGIEYPARGLIWLLYQFQSVVGNWGIAIMMLTLLVRGMLSPLNFRMQKNMRKAGAAMAAMKPKLEALQKKHANDPKMLQVETMKLYREHKVFGAQLAGCLPIFLTMPVWVGLFTALRVMYELRHEPFFGWINDLSTADHVAYIGLGFVDWLNVLPFIMVGAWLYLQMGTPLPKDPQQRQMMQIMRLMPFMFFIFLYDYAAGLMVYMVTSSLWGIAEQKITKKILGPVNPDSALPGTTPMM